MVTPTAAVEVSPSIAPTTSSPLPLPVEAVDGTPLLSTLVQSGAALVAIIAGLLIARLVALAGERSSLERRVRELAEVADARRVGYSEARRERLDNDGEDFIEHIFEHFFDEKDRTFERLYSSYDDEPNDREDLRPYYTRFVSQFESVVERLNSQVDLSAEDRTNWKDEGERDRILQQFPDDPERRIAEKVVELAEEDWDDRRRQITRGKSFYEVAGLESQSMARRLGNLAIPRPDPALLAASRQINSAYYLQLRTNEQNGKSAMEDAERDLTHAEEALAKSSKPEGLIVTILLLAGIAVFGIVLPLTEMTNGDAILSMRLSQQDL